MSITVYPPQASGGGVDIPQQDDAPSSPVEDDLWLDTNEGTAVGLSSILGYAERTSNQSGITGMTDITGLSVTIAVPAGRRIRITGFAASWQSTVADGRVVFYIREGSTVLNDIVQAMDPVANQGNGGGSVMWVGTPSAGTHTYKLSAQGVDASESLTLEATAVGPAFILVEDITGTLWPAGQSIGAGAIAGEAWTDWVPTFVNFTVGNGTVTAKYVRIGRTIHWRLRALLGSTSSIAANPTFTLPVTAAASYGAETEVYGIMGFHDSGSADYRGHARIINSTTARPVIGQAAGTYLTETAPSATIPFTWALNDSFTGYGTYEAAS